MVVLAPCPGCARHVRTTEARCPFCALALDLSSLPAPLVPTERLSRAATLGFQSLLRAGAVAAVTATNLTSCATGTETPIYGSPGDPPGVGGSQGFTGGTGGLGGTSNAGGFGGTNFGGSAGDLGAGAGGEGGEDGSAGSPSVP